MAVARVKSRAKEGGIRLEYTTSGRPVVRCVLVIEEDRSRQGQPQRSFHWARAWGNAAEAIAKVKEGTLMYIEGRLDTEKVNDQWRTIISVTTARPFSMAHEEESDIDDFFGAE